jgi:hypothetical protein
MSKVNGTHVLWNMKATVVLAARGSSVVMAA